MPFSDDPRGYLCNWRVNLESACSHIGYPAVKPVLVTHATRFGAAVRPDERPVLIACRKFHPDLAEDGFLDMERRLNAAVRELARERSLPLVDARLQTVGTGESYGIRAFHRSGARRPWQKW